MTRDFLLSDRKTYGLGTGVPSCLKDRGIYSLNIVNGCPFECSYCVYQCRSGVQNNKTIVYTKISELVDQELRQYLRKGKPIRMVLFNTATDCFFGSADVHRIASECISVLQRHNVFFTLSTKGVIPMDILQSLAKKPELCQINYGISSWSDSFCSTFEPGLPPQADRMECLSRIHRLGLRLRGRIEPLIPMENDSLDSLEAVFRALSRCGAREVVIGYLRMTPEVQDRMARFLPKVHLSMLKRWFRGEDGTPGGTVSREVRKENYDRIKEFGKKIGMNVIVCACRNSDLYRGRCWVVPEAPAAGPKTLL